MSQVKISVVSLPKILKSNVIYTKQKSEKLFLYVNNIAKRNFDIGFSLFALLLSSPIMVIIALLIKIKSPDGSIFFKQKRLGLKGKHFYVYKFRTMIPDAEIILRSNL